jgi:hypothetical protein
VMLSGQEVAFAISNTPRPEMRVEAEKEPQA